MKTAVVILALGLWLPLALLGCQPGNAPSSLDASAPATEDTVPADIFEVRSLGTWRTADASGNYRVVMRRGGFERVQTTISVEWLTFDLAAASPRLVVSRQIELLEELGPITVSGITSEGRHDGLMVAVPVKNTVTGETGVVESKAGVPGELRTRYVTSAMQ